MLDQLPLGDDPAAALLELETFINGTYRATQHPLFLKPMAGVRFEIRRVLPYLEAIRARLGWPLRELDLGLLRLIRRSSAPSPVLGAGAPSWSQLVRLMLEELLDRGLEFHQPVPDESNPGRPPIELLADGSVPTAGGPTWRFIHRVSEVKRFSPEQQQIARRMLGELQTRGPHTDVETLRRGAPLCYHLCGRRLFRLLTNILYTRAKQPSQTHRAIAELAHAQPAPDRGPGLFPGWDSIITYNFDALMSEALAERNLPHVAWAMRGGQLRGDPDELARQSLWHQPIFHVDGYTPSRLFPITDVRFVFSTSQYLTVYQGPPSRILETVYHGIVAKPVHVALYIGCSFADNAMNRLLQQAFAEYPGRCHYALLTWPHDRRGHEPSGEEIEAESAHFLQFGVRPAWFDDFRQRPDLIRQLR